MIEMLTGIALIIFGVALVIDSIKRIKMVMK